MDSLVLAEGAQQIAEGLHRNIFRADGLAQSDQNRMRRSAARFVDEPQLVFPGIEQCQRSHGSGDFVAQIIRPPAIGIDIVEMLMQAARQQTGDYVEILVVMGRQPARVALCFSRAAALRGKVTRDFQFRCG